MKKYSVVHSICLGSGTLHIHTKRGRKWPSYIWCKPNTSFSKKYIIPEVKHEGGSVMLQR